MSTFQRTLFSAVLATVLAAVPLTSHADKKSDCTAEGGAYLGTEADGFCFKCLKADVNTLPLVPEEDTCLKLLKAVASRIEVIKVVSDRCASAGGLLEDRGSKVVCAIRGSHPGAAVSPRTERPSTGASAFEKGSLGGPKANITYNCDKVADHNTPNCKFNGCGQIGATGSDGNRYCLTGSSSSAHAAAGECPPCAALKAPRPDPGVFSGKPKVPAVTTPKPQPSRKSP